MGLSLTVVSNDFPSIAENVERNADNLARILATDVESHARNNTTRVDTGAMKNGWFTEKIGDGIWIVYNSQFYAVYHEYGTYKLSATPMLHPAVEAAKQNRILLSAGFWTGRLA